MAEKILNTRIKLKYDSYANWTNETGAAFVLKEGEVGICAIPSGSTAVNGELSRPQILLKVGDGTSAFSSLPWVSAKAADVYDWAKQVQLPVTKEGTGNVVSSIAWDSATNGIKFTTTSVATSESFDTLNDNLQALTEKVNGMYTNDQIDTAVADAKKAGTDATTALESYKTSNDAAVAQNTNAIATLNGNSSVDGSVDKKIADAINTFATQVSNDGTVNTYKELIDYAATHGAEFTELVGDVAQNTAAIETLNGNSTTAGSVDKKIADAISPINGRVTQLETTTEGYGNIVTHNASEFATSAQGAKADTAIQTITASTGLSVSSDGTSRTVGFDDTTIFILNGGSSTEVI